MLFKGPIHKNDIMDFSDLDIGESFRVLPDREYVYIRMNDDSDGFNAVNLSNGLRYRFKLDRKVTDVNNTVLSELD
jgi:hypothetical protein